MTTEQKQESERKLLRLRIALGIAIVGLLGWIGYSLFESNLRAASSESRAETSESNAQILAQDISTVCEEQGKLMINDRDICVKGETVLANPTEPLPGAKGDKGNPGEDGKPGAMGATGAKGDKGDTGATGAKGDKGDRGTEGVDATGAPGAAGQPGADGAKGDKGDPGADGAPGTPGADGAKGDKGDPGRGVDSAYCGDDAHWLITYSDGTTSDGGVCRTDPGPPPIGIP